MASILETYYRRLTDLSGASKAMLHLRLFAGQDFDFNDLQFYNQKSPTDTLYQLVYGQKSIKLCNVVDSRNKHENELSGRLRVIFRRQQTIEEETGNIDLWVGYPWVWGSFADGAPMRGPLAFYPVVISREGNQWMLSPDTRRDVTLNRGLVLAYMRNGKPKLADELLAPLSLPNSADPIENKTWLYNFLNNCGLELKFDPSWFEDKLIPIDNIKRNEFIAQTQTGVLNVQHSAVAGLYPQADAFLAPDYRFLLDQGFDLHQLFGNGDNADLPADFVQPTLAFEPPPKEYFMPFETDAYQLNAIQQVNDGRGIVVQGPPGSGKSQMIANLVCDAIANSKSVLVVCQKRAALDVVNQRLKQKQLDKFAALVHDFKADRNAICDQIVEQISAIDQYQKRIDDLRLVYLQRSFDQASREAKLIIDELDTFKLALFDEQTAGISVKRLYLESDAQAKRIKIATQLLPHFRYPQVDAFIAQLAHWIHLFINNREKVGTFWLNRASFANQSFSYIDIVLSHLEQAVTLSQTWRLAIEANPLFKPQISSAQLAKLAVEAEPLINIAKTLTSDSVVSFVNRIGEHPADKHNIFEFEEQIYRVLKKNPIDLPVADIVDRITLTKQLLNYCNSGFGRLMLALPIKKFVKLRQYLAEYGLTTNQADEFLCRLEAGTELQSLKQVADQYAIYRGLLIGTDERAVKWWFDLARQALEIRQTFDNYHQYLNLQVLPHNAGGLLTSALYLAYEVAEKRLAWQSSLSTYQLDHLPNSPDDLNKIIGLLKTYFDFIVEEDTLYESFSQAETEICRLLIDFNQQHPDADLLAVFENSLKIEWIERIEETYPILRSVSANRLAHIENRLQQALAQKQSLSEEIVQVKVIKRLLSLVVNNRLGNRVTYRDLYHQASKKRQRWPLRKLFEHFGAEILALCPVWMASPETVSALFPMEKMFDLVIFDEASQCFIEKGIPALFRGKSICIAGDQKQLRPNSLYSARYEEEDTDEVAPEQELHSLLEVAERFLPQVMLRGHYRSRHIPLIEFSNQNFYNGKLMMIPEYKDFGSGIKPIEYIKVEGKWENRSNPIEATKVAELLYDYVNAHPTQSVGVITFNSSQQQVCLDAVETVFERNNKPMPNHIFVKNIENVQGDERDVIFFSLGYGPDKRGKVNAMFGSLNQEGGENRLNVAVTRAKHKIFLVASIWPNQLNTDNALNRGPKLLKSYLEYAYQLSGDPMLDSKIQDNHNGDLVHNQNFPLLKNKLAQYNPDLIPYMHFADLGLMKSGKIEYLVLTDDEKYFGAVSSAENHAFLPVALKNKRWKAKRIYSRDFWIKPEVVLNRIKNDREEE